MGGCRRETDATSVTRVVHISIRKKCIWDDVKLLILNRVTRWPKKLLLEKSRNETVEGQTDI